ncbi:MAG TPA: hypothetical protein VJT49_09280 [Amycolatopsis sp.]|uniref:hypothetical protein n=1 Tax=Amycolatopsis sp. TaxID=37632 RepID=UPI002B49F775|nr:hypothetical protein [Amycolatopsis sp.]HKS45293.1 hypothetical protein [Amycolatopsis sp.]
MTTPAQAQQAATQRVASISTAWERFVKAVNTDPDTALAAWIGYRVTTAAALAEHPEYLPQPQTPPSTDHTTLRTEYEYLHNWAPSIRSGTVEGIGSSTTVRLVTAEERANYERRAAAYPAALQTHERRIQDLAIWYRLMTPGEREELGPDGNYAAQLDDYEQRAQAFTDYSGAQLYPNPRPTDTCGFAPPNIVPPFAGIAQMRMPPLQLPALVESFDQALTQALNA